MKVIILALLIPAFIIGVVAWDRTAERDLGIRPERGNNTPSSLSSLLTTNAQQLVGDFLYLNDVHIHSAARSDIFILSGGQGRQMLLMLQDPQVQTLDTPITADVKGRIRRLPGPLVLRKQWKLTKPQLHAFGHQQIYISAESFVP